MSIITFELNGESVSIDVQPFETLNYVLREKLGLTGTKRGCDTGGCGACTVIVDAQAVYSCMLFAMKVQGRSVITVEALTAKNNGKLDAVQRAFMEKGGLQCGYCTPGFIMSAEALFLENHQPSEEEIREALVGNLCRCTGYIKIIEAIRSVSTNQGMRRNKQTRRGI